MTTRVKNYAYYHAKARSKRLRLIVTSIKAVGIVVVLNRVLRVRMASGSALND